ncbi:HPr family phosphocarrier protein [Mucilaginibacter dorajii]|uniref:HPr family phosphocarrier protein n=1 Tax=Mucilaginibacter dorajii TaxID=692994 RepID=A0ABP7RBE7_9SPHI|nr:HPr family phosphocarrier protein [Mucilaginibacter dorajii]MCS3736621.1 phosphocarrier protein [Mucilaginibacter dorajii]
MISKNYIITAADGIHARPATALVKLTKRFKATISMKKGERTVKINSLLNILSLAAKGGDTITIIVDGEDEVGALVAIDIFFHDELKHL